jgi:hypothetical protein
MDVAAGLDTTPEGHDSQALLGRARISPAGAAAAPGRPDGAGRCGAQGLLGRVRNAAVYLGSLVVEQARVLPMYARLCAGFNVDCFDRELLHSTAMFLCVLTLP